MQLNQDGPHFPSIGTFQLPASLTLGLFGWVVCQDHLGVVVRCNQIKLNVQSGHGSAERRLPRTLKSKSSYGEGKFYIFKQPKRSKAIDIEERNIKL